MSTITSINDALDFLPAAKGGRPTFFATLRIVAEAVREGGDAAHRYQELTGRGVAPADAARTVFAEHYHAR